MHNTLIKGNGPPLTHSHNCKQKRIRQTIINLGKQIPNEVVNSLLEHVLEIDEAFPDEKGAEGENGRISEEEETLGKCERYSVDV